MLTTDRKGAIAEAAIAHHALRLGIEVYRPVMEGSRCDLIFLVGDALVRVQCKWATLQDGIVVVRCYSSRRAREGVRRRYYTPEEIDAFVAYCSNVDRCFFLPKERFPAHTTIQLRLGPTRNNQKAGVHWADDYDLVRLDLNGIAIAGP